VTSPRQPRPELIRNAVAETLRRLRTVRGLSLSDLARASGVAKATLSGLETGAANPTLETLWALSAALGVSLGELVEPPLPSMTVVRAQEGTVVRGDSVIGRLVSTFEAGAIRHEVFHCSVLRKRQISPAHARGVTEHLLVTSGRLRVGPVGEPVELGPGDFLRMSPAWPHLYEGLVKDTQMVLVMQFPQ
jgi:transcriptional regulator with XRE-family HTH domain